MDEVTDGVIPGPAGDLPYRLYRPAGPPGGPRPLVVYFHGGGWVLGNLDSDDPLCRDLCARSGAVVVSVNYRHAPEDRFLAAALDAFAAVQWADANAIELGGIPGQLAVAGWSAGANIAAADFDPLRDEGVAYARALEGAGVPVRLARARGHTHTSVTMVGVVISGAPVRAEIGETLRDFFPSAEPQEHVS